MEKYSNLGKPILRSIFIMTLILASCISPSPSLPASSSLIPDTIETESSLQIQTTTPTSYIMPTGTLTPESMFVPPTAGPDEQVYIDPRGWFSVKIPADWQAGDTPGSFRGEGGFFETGYLPEVMYVGHRLDACQWLANIDQKNTYSMSWISTIRNGCRLETLPGVFPASILEVVVNPAAEYPQRFFYFKADPDNFNQIEANFTWLKPIINNPEQVYQNAPLRSEDRLFWENTTPPPGNLHLKEYKLPEEAQDQSPGDVIFLKFIPPQAKPTVTESKPESSYVPKTLENINLDLEPFGYELTPMNELGLNDLYQDGNLVLENLYRLPDVFINPSPGGDRLAFIAHTAKDPSISFYAVDNAASYLVQNDSITPWEDKHVNPMYTGGNAIWVDGELLILGLGDHTNLQLRKSNYDLVFSFYTYFGTHIPVKQFSVWEDNWILGVTDFIVIDGEILNEKHGFEEVHTWALVDNKPFYFFRKGPRAGFSYDGQFFQDYYHEIVHGYCCGLALNNPRVSDDSIRFFGNRDGVWYYVVLTID